MTLKVNDSGTWKEPTKLSVKDGGSWKEVLTGSVKDGGSWKPFYQRKYTYTVSSDVNKLDLDTVLSADNKLGDVDVVIESGVYVYSDATGTPALLTGSGVAGVLTIINNGYIIGAGGAGGTGGGSAANGSAGGAGGTGLKLEKDITLDKADWDAALDLFKEGRSSRTLDKGSYKYLLDELKRVGHKHGFKIPKDLF